MNLDTQTVRSTLFFYANVKYHFLFVELIIPATIAIAHSVK